MFLNKVEICGVNTSELPLLSDEEKENLFIQIEQGNMDAREQYVKGNLRLVLSVIQRFWRGVIDGVQPFPSGPAQRPDERD